MPAPMPQDLVDYIVELADRFPDLYDEEIIQAAVDFRPGAIAYRQAIIDLYDRTVKEA